MELGYFIMPLHQPPYNQTQTLDDDLEQIILLDQLGYSEAWIGEHFTAEWENIPSPDLFIARALGVTNDIFLGTAVTNLINHNPFSIAHRIALLDHLAHGRLYWGIGSGGFPGDLEASGFDPKTGEHRKATKDSIDLILNLWKDPKPGLYKHKHWEFTVPEPDESIGLRFHLKPFQDPHPRIGVAGTSPNSATLSIAGERGWFPMSGSNVHKSILPSHWTSFEQGAKKGKKIADRTDWRITREIYVSETSAQARQEALDGILAHDFNHYWLKLLSKSNSLERLRNSPEMPLSEITAEYMVDNVWIVGSPKEVAEKIRQLYIDVGGFGVLVNVGHEWKPKDKWIRSMTLLKEEVGSMLADLA